VQLAEIVNHQVEIIGEEGSIRMTCDLDGLPGCQVRINPLQFRDLLSLEPTNFSGIIDSLDGTELAKLGYLAVDVGDLLFEIQIAARAVFIVTVRHFSFRCYRVRD